MSASGHSRYFESEIACPLHLNEQAFSAAISSSESCQLRSSTRAVVFYISCHMIININGWPGVGKLSVAQQLVKRIGRRLLDNHTLFNVAFSLYEFRTPSFYETVRAVRDIAFMRVATLPIDVPVTLTSAYADTTFGQENWAAIREMADTRGSPLCVVVLDCSVTENVRRLQAPERALFGKLIDPAPLVAAREAHHLLEAGGDYLLRFDTSDLKPEESANRIVERLSKERLVPSRPPRRQL